MNATDPVGTHVLAGGVGRIAAAALADARAARTGRFLEAANLHYLASALLELGRLDEARARAQEAFDFMETTGAVGWNPLGYLTLARRSRLYWRSILSATYQS